MDDKTFKWSCLIGAIAVVLAVCVALTPEDSMPKYNTYIPLTVQASAEAKPQYEFSNQILDTTKYQYVIKYTDVYGEDVYLYFNVNGNTWTSRDTICARDSGSYYTHFRVADGSISIANGMCTLEINDKLVIITDFILEQIR